jgi:hypothetical protein
METLNRSHNNLSTTDDNEGLTESFSASPELQNVCVGINNFFLQHWGLNSVCLLGKRSTAWVTLPSPTPFYDESHELFAWGWLQTLSLLISASQVVTGTQKQFLFLKFLLIFNLLFFDHMWSKLCIVNPWVRWAYCTSKNSCIINTLPS